MSDTDPCDPKGLIREAFRIENVTAAECRSIFLDWALSLPSETESGPALKTLLDRYGVEVDHPMTEVLRQGLTGVATPRRRGRWRSRPRH